MKALPKPIGIDPEAVAEYWWQMVRPGHVHEVRIPKTRKGPRNLHGVVSGYFDHPSELIQELSEFTGYDCEGVYITLNPVNPDLIARAANRLNRDGRPVTTADADIVERRNIFVDIDPKRSPGISASNDERDRALAARDKIAQYLGEEIGWPGPVATMETGNGGGLIYRISLPNSLESSTLIARVLKSLKMLFEDDAVTVDTTTSNAARIVKLVGTVAAKGDNTELRPWRQATSTYGLDAVPVPIEMLEEVAANAAEEQRPAPRKQTSGSVPRDLAGEIPTLLARAGIGFSEAVKGYAKVYKLDRCLTSDDHNDGACIMAFPSGAVSYECHHDRCQDKGWSDVRGLLGVEPAPRIAMTVGARTKLEDLRDEEIAASFPPVPDAAYFGLFDVYRNIMGPTSEAPDIFHLGSALTLAGAMIGRRVKAEYNSEELYANLYTVLVGASGSSRKDTAIKRATNLAFWPGTGSTRLISPSFGIARDVSSAEGLIQVLKDRANTLIYLTELSAMIKNARRKGTTTILDRLIEAWDTPESLQNLTKLTPNVALKPYLSIIAATQPGRLASEMTDEDLHSGFANRWLFLFGAGKEPMARPPSVDRKAAWSFYLDLYDAINSYPDGSFIGWDSSADKRWDEWYYATAGKSGKNEEEDAMRVRHATLIQKIALIYAVSEGAKAVADHHLSPAIALIDWMWSILRQLIKGWGVGPLNQLELRIEAVMQQHGSIVRRDLQHLCNNRKWNAKDFAATLNAMIQNGTIDQAEGLLIWPA